MNSGAPTCVQDSRQGSTLRMRVERAPGRTPGPARPLPEACLLLGLSPLSVISDPEVCPGAEEEPLAMEEAQRGWDRQSGPCLSSMWLLPAGSVVTAMTLSQLSSPSCKPIILEAHLFRSLTVPGVPRVGSLKLGSCRFWPSRFWILGCSPLPQPSSVPEL